MKFYILDLNNEFRELKARVHQICEIDLENKSMYNKLKAVGLDTEILTEKERGG